MIIYYSLCCHKMFSSQLDTVGDFGATALNNYHHEITEGISFGKMVHYISKDHGVSTLLRWLLVT